MRKGKSSASKKQISAASKLDNKVVQKEAEISCGWALLDPTRIRYQHSRIRPHFSGCGRSVQQTLDDIRIGKISPNDLPPIQVIVSTDTSLDGQPWYFSLNNRRLWVFKECQKEGLLERQSNMIRVRIRAFKSKREQERYTVQNCSLEAKFIREKHTAAMDTNATNVNRTGNSDEIEEDSNAGGIMPPTLTVTLTDSRMPKPESSAKFARTSSSDNVY